MGYRTVQPWARAVWELAARQHWVVAHFQLIALGIHAQAIKRLIASGRLHTIHRAVYAVGHPEPTQHGLWMAATLACGLGAVLSYLSAAAVWGLLVISRDPIEVSLPPGRRATRPGLIAHRRRPGALEDATTKDRIPVTSPARTLIDIAPRVTRAELERAISEADKLDLISPAKLREAAARDPRWPGAGIVRSVLDPTDFALTDSELERRFLTLARRAGLPLPQTGVRLNGYKVDFFWPDLGLVVETDGLRYHRSPVQQARDRRRDQAHSVAGLTPLRFTHGQVRHEPGYVVETLREVARRLA